MNQNFHLSQRQPEEKLPLRQDELNLIDPFKIQPKQLEEIFTTTQNRNISEELDLLNENGGIDWLFKGLCTSLDGISDDHDYRMKIYGNNKRAVRPPKSYM
ncbi:hypothetical protein pb186bvf_006343 [Paramecium bursaria]